MFPGGGKKEAQDRAEAVSRRRNVAAAQVTDLDSALAEIRISTELDAPYYRPSELDSLKKLVERGQLMLDDLFKEVAQMTASSVGERITDQEAYMLVQPAMRIEAKAAEMRQHLQHATDLKKKLDRSRQNVDQSLVNVEKKKLNVDSALASARPVVEQMGLAHAEKYPETSAALLTSERETSAAAQLLAAARQAHQRSVFHEVLDLCQRADSMLDSAMSKLDSIKLAGKEFEKAAGEAEQKLQKALSRLQEVKNELESLTPIIKIEPNTYLFEAIQRIGEARRATKANPPQNLTCYRLSVEALNLLEDGLQRAVQEANRVKELLANSRSLVQQLQQAVISLRVTINEKQAVPVRASEFYAKAKDERDRLVQINIDSLNLTELEELASSASFALKLAESGLALLV
ncbi:MAG: hypothetical protein HXX08_16750 [Chloroflexi bacterium]|uniref:Uncharacterized protein n=1 Tax=Candidatus Chlorohelix allophototropha TaxID=3003348 RepID=A0A8T7M616_9CHLR|nr:hypothetical protein [Chloroflexota bacterium]WJW69422.1 hypothetical protein OZ401_003032 [Chloroflexota bacterium L227-S17]